MQLGETLLTKFLKTHCLTKLFKNDSTDFETLEKLLVRRPATAPSAYYISVEDEKETIIVKVVGGINTIFKKISIA